jgi:hypothetical protein
MITQNEMFNYLKNKLSSLFSVTVVDAMTVNSPGIFLAVFRLSPAVASMFDVAVRKRFSLTLLIYKKI